ncbi:hypothetical protein [Micromonospora sp. NPDC047527]|uniref:hypothetical protein n=1 Tax=Micromonospora sp. NPDC047527 TaxID=3155144 RepID=UPI0033C28A8A
MADQDDAREPSTDATSLATVIPVPYEPATGAVAEAVEDRLEPHALGHHRRTPAQIDVRARDAPGAPAGFDELPIAWLVAH